jgi:hypothetical protein
MKNLLKYSICLIIILSFTSYLYADKEKLTFYKASKRAAKMIMEATKSTYKTKAYAGVIRVSDVPLGVNQKDVWFPVDGFSLTGPNKNITVENDGARVTVTATYRVVAYANAVKVAAENNVDYEFCVTVNGVCANTPSKMTLISPTSFTEVYEVVNLKLNNLLKVGLAVRNVENTNDIIIIAFINISRLK